MIFCKLEYDPQKNNKLYVLNMDITKNLYLIISINFMLKVKFTIYMHKKYSSKMTIHLYKKHIHVA